MKKTSLLLYLAFSFCGSISFAQQALTPEVLQTLKESYSHDDAHKAIRNAVNANSIKKLTANSEQAATPDTWFSHKVKSSGISDQKSSGRCWLFTGTNVIRAQVMARTGMKNFFFSQAYNFFYDQLEKSNLFLQGIIDTRKKPIDDKMVEWLFRNPLNDGGQFTGISDIIGKYGVVPSSVMPETYSSENTAQISSLITLKLREFGLQLREEGQQKKVTDQQLVARKAEMMKTIYRMLAYGEPVQKFTYTIKGETKEYTPQSFFQEYLGNDLTGNYVMLMNDPTREYYKCYDIDFDRHAYDGRNWTYVNLPVEDIKEMAIKSIKDSTMMYFSCDVAKFLDRKAGTLDIRNFDYASLMGTTFGMDKKQRVQTFASGSSHAMTLMAVDLDKDGKPKKWMVENSWGADAGYKGHLIMTDEWFNEYMFRLVVEKKYVPAKVLDILKQQPIHLPAWDPMFASEE